jgi:hypothetical protein
MTAIAALLAAGSVAGCGAGDFVHRIGGDINPDSLSLADRCGKIMRSAMPFAEIEIETATSDSGHDILTAHVEGKRTDDPKNEAIDRDVAAECRFDNAVMIGFKWTKGGAPVHPAAPAPRASP